MTEWGTHGLWERTAPPPPFTAPLSGDASADVLVIGAGYTGLSTALHLAEAGVSVALLEAEGVGFGASGRNTGLLNAGLWLTPHEVVARMGSDRGGRILAALGDGPRLVVDLVGKHGIECELETSGTLHCAVGAAGAAEVRERAAQWTELGAPVEALDAEATAAKVGTSAFAGSLWDHRAGTVQPLSYARGLARAALAAGARIFTSTRVTGFEHQAAGWIARARDGSVRADWLILATNGYTEGLAPEIRGEFVLLPYFNLATPPLPPELIADILPERQGSWNTLALPTSIRRDRTGRLLIGSVGAPRAGGSLIHRQWAERELSRVFPKLAGVGFESGWHGVLGMTNDHLPRLHALGVNGLSISGCNGRGIAPGTVYGRALAEHILGRLALEELPLQPTSPAPIALRAAREIFYEAGAQIGHAAMGRFNFGAPPVRQSA
jgi:glycine/D-amino acid oxidase-like deaminating enzyme